MRRGLLILGLLGLLAMTGGCYERVVASKGMGGAPVQPSYRSNTAADRAYDSMFGSSPTTFKSANTMPLEGHSKWSTESTGGGVTAPMPTPGSAQGASSGH